MNRSRALKLLELERAVETNCFHAVLYAHNLIDEMRHVEEEEFIEILKKNFIETSSPEPGDIICLSYFNGSGVSYQHAFLQWDSPNTIFQKSGSGPRHEFEITNVADAIMGYNSKLISYTLYNNNLSVSRGNFEALTSKQFIDTDSRVLCYRRKSE